MSTESIAYTAPTLETDSIAVHKRTNMTTLAASIAQRATRTRPADPRPFTVMVHGPNRHETAGDVCCVEVSGASPSPAWDAAAIALHTHMLNHQWDLLGHELTEILPDGKPLCVIIVWSGAPFADDWLKFDDLRPVPSVTIRIEPDLIEQLWQRWDRIHLDAEGAETDFARTAAEILSCEVLRHDHA